jgi:hypothetical protein
VKYPSTEEVETFVRSLFPDYHFKGSDSSLTVVFDGVRQQYTITIAQMYEYVPVNFDMLYRLSDFFETRKINDTRYSSRGCDTCDYGSSYEVKLTVGGDEP